MAARSCCSADSYIQKKYCLIFKLVGVCFRWSFMNFVKWKTTAWNFRKPGFRLNPKKPMWKLKLVALLSVRPYNLFALLLVFILRSTICYTFSSSSALPLLRLVLNYLSRALAALMKISKFFLPFLGLFFFLLLDSKCLDAVYILSVNAVMYASSMSIYVVDESFVDYIMHLPCLSCFNRPCNRKLDVVAICIMVQ